MTYDECLSRIAPADAETRDACLRRWDAVAKPLHSLGLLETLTARMAAVQRTDTPHARRKRVLVFCADNGVIAEGVSQSGSEVTAAVAAALAGGGSNVNIMARCAGADVVAYDVGMASDVDHPLLRRVKCAHGTANLAKGPAMNDPVSSRHRLQSSCAAVAGNRSMHCPSELQRPISSPAAAECWLSRAWPWAA